LGLLAFMKKLTISIWAAVIAVVGVAVAAAQSTSYYDPNALDYTLNGRFLPNAPRVVSVAGVPTLTLTDLEPLGPGAIGVDGSGKIDGVQYARVYFGGTGNHTNNYATFVINVTGSIKSKGTVPTVKMTLKGYGYDFDAQSDHPDASLKLTFTSSSAPTPVYPYQLITVTNTAYTVTFTNGSPVLLTTNVPTPYSGYYVNPTNYAVTFLFTNGPATFVNSIPYSTVAGTITGTIRPGKKSNANGGKPRQVNEPAALFTESWVWTVVDQTNVVQRYVGGSLLVNVLTNLTGQVVQPYPGTKLYLSGELGSLFDPYSGSGSVDYKKATYKMKLKGVSSARGASLDVDGTLGPVIIGYEQTTNANFPTGYVTNYLQNALKQISFSGKAMGQKIPLTSGINAGVPFPTSP
jgi:hypothetical protein